MLYYFLIRIQLQDMVGWSIIPFHIQEEGNMEQNILKASQFLMRKQLYFSSFHGKHLKFNKERY